MPRRGGGGMGRPGGGYPSQSSNYKGTVRWESAQPVLDALKTPLPEAFANLYVIGTRDIPFLETNQRQSQNTNDNDQDQPKLSTPDNDADSAATKRTVERIKYATTLQVKGKDSVSPKVVQQMTPGGSYFLLDSPRTPSTSGRKTTKSISPRNSAGWSSKPSSTLPRCSIAEKQRCKGSTRSTPKGYPTRPESPRHSRLQTQR